MNELDVEPEMKKSRYMLLILALALFPSTASANAGTPLMWASMLHLVFGNAIIGLIEGQLLAWLFKCTRWKSILILIAANYASAWAGGFLVAGLPSRVDITIQNIQSWFLIFVVAAFVVTFLIEFAFFWIALGSREHRLRRTLTATLAVNGISYVFLCSWYWIASGTSMLTQLEVVSLDKMKLPEPYALYYLSSGGDQVIRMNPTDPDSKQTISKVTAYHRNDRLFARPSRNTGFDLFVYLDSEEHESATESKVLENFSEQGPVEWGIADRHSEKAEASWFNFGQVPVVGTESDWKFSTGFWPSEGISGENQKAGKSVQYSLELPFVAWSVRNATQISGDYVVAQLGADQICLMNPESGRIALIARGKGPIVAKPKISNNAVDSTPTGVTPPAGQELRHRRP